MRIFLDQSIVHFVKLHKEIFFTLLTLLSPTIVTLGCIIWRNQVEFSLNFRPGHGFPLSAGLETIAAETADANGLFFSIMMEPSPLLPCIEGGAETNADQIKLQSQGAEERYICEISRGRPVRSNSVTAITEQIKTASPGLG